MKKSRIFLALSLAIAFFPPTVAHAAGIPLSYCEKLTGNLPPSNGVISWAANGVCSDSIFSIGGRTFFFQQNQNSRDSKGSIDYWTQLYVQDSSKNWKDLGKAPLIDGPDATPPTASNFLATPEGLFLGGFFTSKVTGICGTANCREVRQFVTLKIDALNRVTKFTHPSVIGTNKSPGAPFASGTPNLIYFAQPQGLVTTFGKKGVATVSGQTVKKGTAFRYYSLDLASNELKPLSQLSSIAAEEGIDLINTFAGSLIIRHPQSNKILQMSPSGKLVTLDWDSKESYVPIKDGIVSTVKNTNSLLFRFEDGNSRRCAYAGEKNLLPINNPAIRNSFEVRGSNAGNTVSVPFKIEGFNEWYSFKVNSDCSTSFNDLGNDIEANQKYLEEMTNQVVGEAYEGVVLQMFTPEGYVFDKVLMTAYQAIGVNSQGFSGPRVTCTVDESKVAKMVSDVFLGKNYGDWKFNPSALGAKCSYPGEQKFKIVDPWFLISLHYVRGNTP